MDPDPLPSLSLRALVWSSAIIGPLCEKAPFPAILAARRSTSLPWVSVHKVLLHTACPWIRSTLGQAFTV